jgi:SnoaL-like domain
MTTAKFAALLEANVRRVFNERDERRRTRAIEELYSPDATLYEPDATFIGTKAIADAVTRLLGALPPTLTFALAGPVLRNHDLAKLRWLGTLPDGKTVVTGTDVVKVEGGRILTIHVFVDPS